MCPHIHKGAIDVVRARQRPRPQSHTIHVICRRYRVTTYKMQQSKTFPPLSLSGLECLAVSLTGKLVWESVFAPVVLLLCFIVADRLAHQESRGKA